MGRKLAQIGILVFVVAFSAGVIHANSFTFTTPTGSTAGGGPVSASATVTTGAGVVTIVLNNLQANITDVAQAISDFDFVLSNGATTGTLMTSSAQQISIGSGGTATVGSTGSTGWKIDTSVSSGIGLTVLGTTMGPAGLIVGPAGAGGVFTNANGSIAGNGPHNPFLNQTANFTVAVSGVTAATNVTGVTFSFGTTAGSNVTGTPSTPTPEPETLALFGMGLLGIGGIVRRKFSGRA